MTLVRPIAFCSVFGQGICISVTTSLSVSVEAMSMLKQLCGLPTGLKREWIIGQHLNKLRGPKGELQGATAVDSI